MKNNLFSAFSTSIVLILGHVAEAQMIEFGKPQPKTRRIVQKMANPTEGGKFFLALDFGEQLMSSQTKSEIVITRANRICKKYGYDGVHFPSSSPFELQDSRTDRDLLVVNNQNQLVTHQEFPKDMDFQVSSIAKEFVIFTGKSFRWMFTLGFLGEEPQKFTQLECQKLIQSDN